MVVQAEAETLLEMQIKGMATGKIAQYLMLYYGVKIDLGQAKETAFQQAITVIRDPKIKRRPDSHILAGLDTIQNDTPDKEDDEGGPGPIHSGTPAPVVPAKNDASEDDSDIKENTDASGEKLFKEMNADDWDDISREEIMAKVKRMYGVEMANTGNKTVVVNKASDIENAALETKAILDRDK